MDKGKAGRRRSSSEIVTQGKRKKSSSSELHKITKMLSAKPEAVCVKSQVSKLRSSEQWDLPLQRLERSLRNKGLSVDHKSEKGVRGRPVTSKTSLERIPRVTLTNVLGTELGRKYIKTSPVTEATLGDADNLQSEQLSSSSDGSLESCQNLNPHKSFFLPERSTQPSKTVDKNYTKRATYTKEKRRGDDGISLVVSDTQAEGGCQFKPLLAFLKTLTVEVEVVIILKRGAEARMVHILIQKWNQLSFPGRGRKGLEVIYLILIIPLLYICQQNRQKNMKMT
ncbi:sentrin-specific protease 7 isoform X7 [Saccopteryx leptura]|uniref:sentrin-specific protease 7 isoform X7 n=1 Tax=Saccopteryx leptura TaxID=249018 RepID=UPI00339C28E3